MGRTLPLNDLRRILQQLLSTFGSVLILLKPYQINDNGVCGNDILFIESLSQSDGLFRFTNALFIESGHAIGNCEIGPSSRVARRL